MEVRGLSEADQITFLKPENGQVNLEIRGENSIVNSLSASSFQVYVDASEAENGRNLLDVSVEGPENVTWTISIPSITLDVLRA